MLLISVAALALGAVALAAAGCGGSSSKTDSVSAASATTAPTNSAATLPTTAPAIKLASGTPLSRSTWIARGDAICARTNTKLATISVKSVTELERTLPQIAIYTRTESTDLSKLVPPTPMTRDWAQIVDSLQLYSEYASGIARYLLAKDESAARPLFHTAVKLHEQTFATALRDGFRHCSHAR
jgi:hypothetical protein